MKILVLTALYPPLGHSGHDERCRLAVAGMSACGHSLQVLTSRHRLPPIGAVDERRVFRELCLYEDSANADQLGEAYRETVIHESHNLGELRFRLARFQPDLVWVWNVKGLSKSLLFYLEDSDHQVVYDLHSDWLAGGTFDDDPWQNWWSSGRAGARLRRWWHSFVGPFRSRPPVPQVGQAGELDLRHSYLCSESLRRKLIAAGIEGARELPVIYPFADESRIPSKETYRPGGSRLMWAGRLSRLKAPELALEALVILRDRGIHLDLDIFAIGSPRERKLFRGRIDAAGLGDRVSMRSIRPGELVEHYHTYDCFLFTSRSDDPFPVTVQEAILSGLPCILSRSGGIPEAIGEREDCIYVRNGDAEDLAAGIERFLKLPDGGRALAEACILGLRREGSFEKLRDHLESIA